METLCDLAEQGALELSVVHRRHYDGVLVGRSCRSVDLSSIPGRLDGLFASYLGTGVHACRTGAFDIAVSPRTCLAARRSARIAVVTIHDMQHRRLPHFFSRGRKLLRDWLYQRAAATADHIVCETEHVKRDIVECYGTPPRKIHVIPSPPPSYVANAFIDEDKMARVARKYRLPSGYLFYPAQFWFHKNHLLLIETLAILKATFGLDVPLVLVGSPKEGFAPTMRRVRDLRLEDQVVYLGYVPDDEMPYLFKGAAALVVPSLFESLSIPVWEAFQLGVPVVCANTCAFPEQVGSAALLFDPSNASDCAQKVNVCLTNRTVARSMVAQGRVRVGQLTFKRYGQQWMDVLNGAG